MQRCIQLAQLGLGHVAPNPMVGSVIVKEGKIIGEGFHRKIGGKHAEVNAIESVTNISDLDNSTLYVNLEPCTHHGKTPPCVDRILQTGIKTVVIAGKDPSLKVNGKGIDILRTAGREVITGISTREEEFLNRRFRTYHEKKRPYVILKWAQSSDGYMDIDRKNGLTGQFRISSDASQRLLHKWRSEEQAIMVGTNTVLNDDPSLTVRLVEGKNPLRLILDLKGRLPQSLNVFNDGIRTLVYTHEEKDKFNNVEFVKINAEENTLNEVLNDLWKREIRSLIVEGGQKLLNSFIEADLWDEIRIFKSRIEISSGLKAPIIDRVMSSTMDLGTDSYVQYFRT